MTFVTPVDGQPAIAEHVAQLTETLSAGRSIPVYIRDLEVMSRGAVNQGLELFVHTAAQRNPATGYSFLYAKNDDKLWLRKDDGSETMVGGSSFNPLLAGPAIGLGVNQTASDVFLYRDNLNVLAQRNGAAIQTLRLYGTYVDAGNWERLAFTYGGGAFRIVSEQGGTTQSRPIEIASLTNLTLSANTGNHVDILAGGGSYQWTFNGIDGALRGANGTAALPGYSFLTDSNTGVYRVGADQLGFATAGVSRWQINATGHLLAAADNTYDIGASGATRPRDLYVSGNVNASQVISGTVGTAIAAALNLRMGGVNRWSIDPSGHFTAATDNTYDIGTSASRPRDIYSNTVNVPTVGTTNTAALTFRTNSSSRWTITGSSGHLNPAADNTYDLGASGSRPRDLFLGRHLTVGGYVRGDFSAAFHYQRVLVQTTVANSPTFIGAVPLGTSLVAGYNAYSQADVDNSSIAQLFSDGTVAGVSSSRSGTGSFLPLTFRTSDTERMRIDTAGVISVGGIPQPKISVAASAPSSPTTGDLWVW